MATPEQITKLLWFRDAAKAAGHIWPVMAACEAVLESTWGTSQLAIEGNNLFGQKQHAGAPPIFETLTLPTEEYISGRWVTVEAQWVKFPAIADCFRERMNTLNDLKHFYRDYADALCATTGEDFVEAVSRKWSTDPMRAVKVLQIYHAHADVLGAAVR